MLRKKLFSLLMSAAMISASLVSAAAPVHAVTLPTASVELSADSPDSADASKTVCSHDHIAVFDLKGTDVPMSTQTTTPVFTTTKITTTIAGLDSFALLQSQYTITVGETGIVAVCGAAEPDTAVSSDPEILAVDGRAFTGLKEGSADIILTKNSQTVTAHVTVTAPTDTTTSAPHIPPTSETTTTTSFVPKYDFTTQSCYEVYLGYYATVPIYETNDTTTVTAYIEDEDIAVIDLMKGLPEIDLGMVVLQVSGVNVGETKLYIEIPGKEMVFDIIIKELITTALPESTQTTTTTRTLLAYPCQRCGTIMIDGEEILTPEGYMCPDCLGLVTTTSPYPETTNTTEETTTLCDTTTTSPVENSHPTTAVNYTVPQGDYITIPIYETTDTTAVTVYMEDENIAVIDEIEGLDDLVNIHVTGMQIGETKLHVVLPDEELVFGIIVSAPRTTAPPDSSGSGTTAFTGTHPAYYYCDYCGVQIPYGEEIKTPLGMTVCKDCRSMGMGGTTTANRTGTTTAPHSTTTPPASTTAPITSTTATGAGQSGQETARTYSTPEELIALLVADDKNFSNGGLLYSDKYSFDARLNAGIYGNTDYLIVYGVDTDTTLSDLILNVQEYQCAYDVPGDLIHSGFTIQVKNNNIESGNPISIVFFKKNTLPGFMTETDLVSACGSYGFDIAPYIYEDLTPGDINNDGLIDAVDASMILSGYAALSVNSDMQLNSTLFDCNNDGYIDAVDASMVLSYYASNSSGGKMSWEDFDKQYSLMT